MSNIWGAITGGAILSTFGWLVAGTSWYNHTLVSAASTDQYGITTDAVYATHGSQGWMYFGIAAAGVGELIAFVALVALAVAWGIRVAREDATKPAPTPYTPKPSPWDSAAKS